MLKLSQILFPLLALPLLVPAAHSAPLDPQPHPAAASAKTPDSTAKPATATPAKRAKRKQKVKRKQRRGCRTHASLRYRRMMQRWSKVPRIRRPRYRDGFRELVIYAVNHGERIRVFPFLADGTLDPEALEKIQRAFRDKKTGAVRPIHPRLVKLIYKLADSLDARQVNLISGYRAPNGEPTLESRHCEGKAADIVIPGVPLAAVARKARALGHVGVGFYPNSGFVHLDVRKRRSYFWVDRSGPGQPSCHLTILSTAAPRFDRKWKPRHDEPKVHTNKRGEPKGERTASTKPGADETT